MCKSMKRSSENNNNTFVKRGTRKRFWRSGNANDCIRKKKKNNNSKQFTLRENGTAMVREMMCVMDQRLADVILFIISLIVVGMLCTEVLSTFPLVWKKSKCIRERNQAIEDKNVYKDFDKFMRNPLIRRMILNSFNRRVK